MKYNVLVILGPFKAFVTKSLVDIVSAEQIMSKLRSSLSSDVTIKIVQYA